MLPKQADWPQGAMLYPAFARIARACLLFDLDPGGATRLETKDGGALRVWLCKVRERALHCKVSLA